MALVYIILSMTSFGILGITFKVSDHFKCNKQQINFLLYFTAAVIQIIWMTAYGKTALSASVIAIGSCAGIFSFIGILCLRKALSKGRISTTWTIINLGLIVPVIVSAFVWNEIPKPKEYIGIIFTIIAVILFGIDIGRSGE